MYLMMPLRRVRFYRMIISLLSISNKCISCVIRFMFIDDQYFTYKGVIHHWKSGLHKIFWEDRSLFYLYIHASLLLI